MSIWSSVSAQALKLYSCQSSFLDQFVEWFESVSEKIVAELRCKECFLWSPMVSAFLSLLLLLCVMLDIRFSLCMFFSMYWSLSKSCYWTIHSFQWFTGFGLSSGGYWHRDWRMAAGRKILADSAFCGPIQVIISISLGTRYKPFILFHLF